MVEPLLSTFPGLARGGYRKTSPADKRYNCIAYAASDNQHWWWPMPDGVQEVYWPADVARQETLSTFRDAFASLGYVECRGADLEPGYEKIAVFANDQGVPLHAARQRPEGAWTSKLGELEDIDHTLDDLEGEAYGSVALVMKRPLGRAERAEAEQGATKSPSRENEPSDLSSSS
jgi:hypothetical protein